MKASSVVSPALLQDSGVLCDRAEGREDRGGGRAETRLHRGGQLPVDEPRAAGTSHLTCYFDQIQFLGHYVSSRI